MILLYSLFGARETKHALRILLTWILGVVSKQLIKTDPWPSRRLHHFGKFLEPSDEWAGRGCYCFLMRRHSWSFLTYQEWAPETCRAKNLNFSVLTLLMSLRYFGNELYNRGPNTVIAFSSRDCAGFLFVRYWINHCFPCLGCFLVFIVCPIMPSIFGTVCCVILKIYITL